MEMHQIRYFLAAAEDLNFTRAAERCNVAQPSMTRAIRLLEEELGGALFNRERANTHMTELGRVMKPHLEQMWHMAQATRGLASEILGLKKTRLRLGVMCTITPEVMVGTLKAMNASYPGIQIEILDDAAPQLVERLLRGELDVAIVCMEEKIDERLHLQSVFKEQMKIVVSLSHRLAQQDEIRIQDLNGERYLERIDCEVATRIGQLFEDQGFNDETVCRSERDDWIIEMAAAGFGYACMPGSSIHHTGVVARPLANPEIWRKIHLVTVRGRPHSPAVGALVQQVMATEWLGKKALARKRAAELPDYDFK
jgi:LysR family transcriptional regulator, hydrogen peroxide-inducible genes activator